MRKEIKQLGGDTIAKDGTYRGGRRVKAGGKPQPAAEKIEKGKKVEILMKDIPTPSDYLSEKQKNGIPLGADEIYKETWSWLKQRNCENLVNPRLLESYSQAFARYIQCEEAISQFGLLGKHPTTGGVIASPFVQMSSQFQKTANLLWYEIYDIVKENCTEVYEDYGEDMMEKLLRQRR